MNWKKVNLNLNDSKSIWYIRTGIYGYIIMTLILSSWPIGLYLLVRS